MMLSSRLIEVRPGNARLARIRLTTVALALLAFAAVARAGRTPTVPANLQVPATQVVAFHAYAAGVQIYVCDPTKPGWIFKAPEATLYDADMRHHQALGRMLALVGGLARREGAAEGFRTIINTGRVGHQEVYHVHMHVLGGPEPLGPMLQRRK